MIAERISPRAVGVLLLAAWVVRGTALVFLEIVSRYNQLLSPFGLWGAARLAIGIGLVRWLLVRARGWSGSEPVWRGTAWAALGLVGLAVGARYAWMAHSGELPKDDYVRRELGVYPYPGGAVLQEEVGDGGQTLTTILPQGHRPCGAQPASGRRIGLIGDSFVFGKGLSDEQTLCVQLSALAAGRSDGLTWLNLGQEGASLKSYTDNLRFAVEVHEVDAAFVGLLLPDDSLPFDVNDRDRVLIDSLLLRVLTAALDRRALLTVLPAITELCYADFVSQRIVRRGLERLAATAAELKVPVKLYLYGHPRLVTAWYETQAREIAADNPWFQVVGTLVPPPEVDALIPGDGHPSGEGNRWVAEQLVEQLDGWGAP